jgi:hypothetical protein
MMDKESVFRKLDNRNAVAFSFRGKTVRKLIVWNEQGLGHCSTLSGRVPPPGPKLVSSIHQMRRGQSSHPVSPIPFRSNWRDVQLNTIHASET